MTKGKPHVCPWWAAYTFDNPLRRLVHNPVRIISPYLKEGRKAVDIGCGMGYFTVAMARITGPAGRVYALDIQQKMLDLTMKRAARRNLSGWITPVLTSSGDLNFSTSSDFALLFWAAHEFPDRPALFGQIHSFLTSAGTLLIAEPRFHVGEEHFRSIIDDASAAGLRMISSPPVALSRTALLAGGPA